MKKTSLAKDHFETLWVSGDGFQKRLSWRWTLYKNGGLVVLQQFNKEVSQHLLYLNSRNQSLRIALMSRNETYGMLPYILIIFKAFDFKKNTAEFELYLWDKDEKVELKFPKKEG